MLCRRFDAGCGPDQPLALRVEASNQLAVIVEQTWSLRGKRQLRRDIGDPKNPHELGIYCSIDVFAGSSQEGLPGGRPGRGPARTMRAATGTAQGTRFSGSCEVVLGAPFRHVDSPTTLWCGPM